MGGPVPGMRGPVLIHVRLTQTGRNVNIMIRASKAPFQKMTVLKSPIITCNTPLLFLICVEFWLNFCSDTLLTLLS